MAKCPSETGLAASRLTLEISEDAVRRDEVRFREAVDRLHALGVSVSLDSFDAGCEIGQGALYHRPMPVADFAALLQAETRCSTHTSRRIGKAVAAE